MRKLLRRIYFHYDRLSTALNDAHNADLIKYDQYAGNAPCESLWQCRERVEKTTAPQIANIIQSQVRNSV